jgi:hypothetical protein
MLGEWSGDGGVPWYDDNGGSTAVQHGAPEGCSLSELLMAATQSRLLANPGMINTHRNTTWPPESAKDVRTLTPSRRNWTPRAGATPTPEKKAV